MSRRLCLLLDLVDDASAWARYDHAHRPGGPPKVVSDNLRAMGVIEMDIYRLADRLVMICEVEDDFAGFGQTDADDPAIRQWDMDMRQLQRAISCSNSDSWAPAERVYRLSEQP